MTIAATPEEAALERVADYVAQFKRHKVELEVTWYVVHHDYGTWLHLAAVDLSLRPDNRKYRRAERYRFACFMEMGVMPVFEGVKIEAESMLGTCKECTEIWRLNNGYGVEDDIDAVDDLPFYLPKERM